VDETLLSLLACPEDQGPLLYVKADLEVFYNPRLRRVYQVKNGIPVLLTDEARDATDAEHADFSARGK
jgi:uncharacterized protein YbaR (Trm112 family)